MFKLVSWVNHSSCTEPIFHLFTKCHQVINVQYPITLNCPWQDKIDFEVRLFFFINITVKKTQQANLMMGIPSLVTNLSNLSCRSIWIGTFKSIPLEQFNAFTIRIIEYSNGDGFSFEYFRNEMLSSWTDKITEVNYFLASTPSNSHSINECVNWKKRSLRDKNTDSGLLC